MQGVGKRCAVGNLASRPESRISCAGTAGPLPLCLVMDIPNVVPCELQSKLLKGGWIGDYLGEYNSGY